MLNVFKALGRLLAHVLDPLIRTFGQLGMILIFPAPRSFAECAALLPAPDFPLHQIYNKGGALLPATLSIATASCRGIETRLRGLRICLCFSKPKYRAG